MNHYQIPIRSTITSYLDAGTNIEEIVNLYILVLSVQIVYFLIISL